MSLHHSSRYPDSPFDGAWHLPLCIAGLVAAAALFVSWIAPVTRAWWNALDVAVFRAFNFTLAEPGWWQSFWAITNWRPFDLVAAAVIFFFTLAWLRADASVHAHVRLAHFLAFCVLLLLAKACEYLLSTYIGYRRESPTLVYEDAIRLSELVTWIRVKDRGSTVFPGDHAFVLFATIGFFRIRAGRRMGVIAALALMPFALPRVVIGAHWTTDVLIGGLAMALALLALGYATPFAARLAAAIDRYAAPLLRLCVQSGKILRMLR
ncbi:MAG: phosphatase PAP2 family protein [Burkholderiales bacterium]|nr:phosphatase PAP2 family protein [Burkholderiales bacterium]